MVCSICGNHFRDGIYCGSCASFLVLRPRINQIKISSQLSSLTESIDAVLSSYQKGEHQINLHNNESLLEEELKFLEFQVDTLQKAVESCKTEVAQTETKVAALRRMQFDSVTSMVELKKVLEKAGSGSPPGLQKVLYERRKEYESACTIFRMLQEKCLSDLLQIFEMRRVDRYGAGDIILGVHVIPNLSRLSAYSLATINSGLECLSDFILYLASYLFLPLPHPILPPQKPRFLFRIGTKAIPVRAKRLINVLVQQDPSQFQSFCTMLAMLFVDLNYIACSLDRTKPQRIKANPSSTTLAEVHSIIMNLARSIAIDLQIFRESADLDALNEYIVALVSERSNGTASEWKFVRSPAAGFKH